MKKRCLIAGGGLLVFLAIASLLLPSRQPVANGKPIGFWIRELPEMKVTPMGFRDPNTPAQEAIRLMGTNALPYLVEAMERKERSFTHVYNRLLNHLPTWAIERLPRPIYSIAIRREAARTLARILPNYPDRRFDELVPSLAKTAHGPDVDNRVTAIGILGALACQHGSSTAFMELTKALDSPHPELRSHSAYKLGECADRAKSALPKLLQLLSDEEASARIDASRTIFRVGGPVDKVVEVLIAALSSTDATIRGNAASVLAEIGPPAKPAWVALEHLSKDTNSYSRQWAEQAKKKIDPLKFYEERVMMKPEEIAARLSDVETRWNMASDLKEMGAAAKPFLPLLFHELEFGKPDDLWIIADTIYAIDPEQGHRLVQPMADYLSNRMKSAGLRPGTAVMNRHVAASILGRIGLKEAILPLASALHDKDPFVRQHAALALFQISGVRGPVRHEATIVLEEAMRLTSDPDHRRHLITQIAKLGPKRQRWCRS